VAIDSNIEKSAPLVKSEVGRRETPFGDLISCPFALPVIMRIPNYSRILSLSLSNDYYTMKNTVPVKGYLRLCGRCARVSSSAISSPPLEMVGKTFSPGSNFISTLSSGFFIIDKVVSHLEDDIPYLQTASRSGGIDADVDDKGAVLKVVVPDAQKGLYK